MSGVLHVDSYLGLLLIPAALSLGLETSKREVSLGMGGGCNSQRNGAYIGGMWRVSGLWSQLGGVE